MKHYNLNEMLKGWFVGSFEPTAFATEDCEVAVKRYLSGDSEDEHFHKLATEITVIISGAVEMVGRTWVAGDILVLAPGEATAFLALEDTLTVVVKVPGARNDKYLTDAT